MAGGRGATLLGNRSDKPEAVAGTAGTTAPQGAGYGAITDRAAGIVNAYYRRPILVFYLHDRLEVMVQSYHGNINHILDELINVSIQAYSANTLVAQ